MASSFGALDLFVGGSGFDIAGAWLLASGIMVSPRRAAGRMIQGRNTFARFDVRAAEDYADGQIGRASLALGFGLQALGYVLSAHGVAPLLHAFTAYFLLVAFALAAIAIVFALRNKMAAKLRDRWLVEYAKIDNMGWVHALPSGSELFTFGQILGKRPYQREFGDNDAYARRVFNTSTRDVSKDREARPENFQPYGVLDDTHGYFYDQPKRRWRLRRGRAKPDPPSESSA